MILVLQMRPDMLSNRYRSQLATCIMRNTGNCLVNSDFDKFDKGVVVQDHDVFVGCCFGVITSGQLKVSHLCVDEQHRFTGYATSMLQMLQTGEFDIYVHIPNSIQAKPILKFFQNRNFEVDCETQTDITLKKLCWKQN